MSTNKNIGDFSKAVSTETCLCSMLEFCSDVLAANGCIEDAQHQQPNVICPDLIHLAGFFKIEGTFRVTVASKRAG